MHNCYWSDVQGQAIEGNQEELDELLGQVEIWHYMTCLTDSVALKVAVELRIADIIDHHGQPMSLQKIVDNIEELARQYDEIRRHLEVLQSDQSWRGVGTSSSVDVIRTELA